MTSIRHFLNIVESAGRVSLMEAVETVHTKAEGKVVVLRNPSVAELLNAARRKDMRGLVDRNGDAFWWPASAAIHASVASALGLTAGDIYKRDGIARTMIRGTVLDLISGWQTAFRSREITALTNHGVRLKWGRDTLTLDEFVARLGEVDRLNGVVTESVEDDGPKTLLDVARHFLSVYDDLDEAPPISDEQAMRVIRKNYLTGDCGDFAVAVHLRTGWPIFYIRENGLHVFTQAPDGRFVDFSGYVTLDTMRKRYGFKEAVPQPMTKEEASMNLGEMRYEPWNEVRVADFVIGQLKRAPFSRMGASKLPPLESP